MTGQYAPRCNGAFEYFLSLLRESLLRFESGLWLHPSCGSADFIADMS
jgi:hypothetical protein